MKPTLILVDDMPTVRAKLRELLQNDFDVLAEAGTGAEAIEACKRNPPHVVLMDLVMPGMTGIEAMRQILDSVQPPPRVVIMSGLQTESVVMQAFEAGAVDYLLKPIDGQTLREVLLSFARAEAA
jgi:CheY-like chemotaxis protein